MKGWLLGCLLLGFSTVRAQTVYESFEVDTVCKPQGGQTTLQLFIQSNLSVPVRAQADRVAGRVFVSGVVEPDGTISSPSVTRGLRPDCNREALRVFRLFNAWVPARKDGQPVRQRVNYPIPFSPGSPVYVQDGNLTQYFAPSGDPVANTAATVVYRQTTPVDTLTGLPTGDRIVYERKGTKWRELTRFRLVRVPAMSDECDPGQQRTQLIFLDAQNQRSQTMYALYPNGLVASQTTFDSGTGESDKQEYAPNGMLEATEHQERTSLGVVDMQGRTTNGRTTQQPVTISRIRRTVWHSNGQLAQVEVRSAPAPPNQPVTPTQLISMWDSTGTALVTDGNGQATYTQEATSRNDYTKKTTLAETGPVRDGLREGNWTGRYTDGSYKYDEVYEAGIIKSGTSQVTGREPVAYKAVEQNPQPTGGMQGLSQYLARSLRYPVDAQRSRVQGIVFVSFIVNTDGTIQDVQVQKGVGRGCDEEAMRVVSGMPRWQPGMQRGEPVRVKFNLPISFTLQ